MRITEVRAFVLDVPMRKAFGIAGGAQELARNVLVEVTLENGVVGLGEAAPLPPFNGETQVDALAALASVDLVGHDVGEWKALGERLEGLSSASAACALETAAIDALTRARSQSLCSFFGGAEHELVTDITITTGTVEEAGREAAEFSAFRTLKTKVGGRDVDLDVARILAIKEARPDARLMIDANAGYALAEAHYLLDELAKRNALPDLFEQPFAVRSRPSPRFVRASLSPSTNPSRSRPMSSSHIARTPATP